MKRRTLLLVTSGLVAVGIYSAYTLFQYTQSSDTQPILEDHTPAFAEDEVSFAGEPDSETIESAYTPLWTVLDEASQPELPPFPHDWSTKGRVLVKVDATLDVAPSWRVGDNLSIPLPQLDQIYRPEIEEINDGLGGSRSVTGKIVGQDGLHRRFVVTVGAGSVFAYIDTPTGPYELVAWKKVGWLLPTASMMAGIDPDEPDYILQDGDPT